MIVKDNFENSLHSTFWSLKRIESKDISFSKEIRRNGNYSLRVTINPGDKLERNTERSEISEKNSHYLPLNTNVVYKFSVFFPKDFLISSNRFVFAQLKQKSFSSESPFISLRYSSGILNFQIQYDGIKKNFKKKLDLRGKWSDFKIEYELKDNGKGYTNLYINNILFKSYKGKLGHKKENDLVYFKMGIYRDCIDLSQILYFDKFTREWNA